jgi:hypothetical protein
LRRALHELRCRRILGAVLREAGGAILDRSTVDLLERELA